MTNPFALMTWLWLEGNNTNTTTTKSNAIESQKVSTTFGMTRKRPQMTVMEV